MKFSQTKVTTWQRCHAAFHYRYVMKLRKKRPPRPLMFGRIVHDMIETDANGANAFTALRKIDHEQGKQFRAQEEEYGRIIQDAEDIMTDYFDYWNDPAHGRLEYVKLGDKRSEFTFEVEVAKDIIVNGKIDNIAVTPNKLRWLVEHKTGKSYPNEDHRWRNLQSSIYIRILDIAGVTKKLDGTLWDFIRSKPPTRPQILKSGKLSTRAIDTLPSAVKRFMKEEQIKSAPDLLRVAKENRSSYFKRTFSSVKKPVIDSLYNDFVSAARQIADQGHKVKDKHIGRHCEWCQYESICRTEILGHDVDFIKKLDYTVEEAREDEEVDIEA